MEWQDIATAPTDGTEIIAASIYEMKGRKRVWAVYHAAHDGTGWVGAKGSDLRPTHWISLPEPPK